jgi:chaperonin GroEL
MEYNQPSEIVKDLNFGDQAKNRISTGVDKLARAVKSTLGASGKCVIYEDARGNPVITKDGVTVAESVVLFDPVENIGATLIKEASRNTVKEAGDGTTTAIVLAQSLLKGVNALKG